MAFTLPRSSGVSAHRTEPCSAGRSGDISPMYAAKREVAEFERWSSREIRLRVVRMTGVFGALKA